MVADTVREEQAIRQMTERLVENFGGTYSAEHIEAVVGAGRRRFDGHPVRQFVPILVERFARRQLVPETGAPTPAPSAGKVKMRKGTAAHRAVSPEVGESGDLREP
ncbi:three-helix bundle dimerization domain-containing protein [Nocardia brasiliensis]|uniref:three-helix bundle dimerization domain-containing protein n=1 Tax=Nocardia brasiliensis TaxID=37326 RepID=UPI000DFA98B9|nr:hypothetical protein [Nocardia brasiliensis]SUB09457.1 Uncharacterised protein [Nocardia brasiliensis]